VVEKDCDMMFDSKNEILENLCTHSLDGGIPLPSDAFLYE